MINIDNRDQIQLQIISNLITAEVLEQDEAEFYNILLSAMPYSEVLAALVESHRLRDQRRNPANYYPIGEISRN